MFSLQEMHLSSWGGFREVTMGNKDQLKKELRKITNGIGSPYGEGATYNGRVEDRDSCHLDESDQDKLEEDLIELFSQHLDSLEKQHREEVEKFGKKMLEHLDGYYEANNDGEFGQGVRFVWANMRLQIEQYLATQSASSEEGEKEKDGK